MIQEKINELKTKTGILEITTPRNGRCRIFYIDDENINYIQGKSSVFTYSLTVFFETYNYFKGKECTTKKLREYNREVYTTNPQGGHNCNCMAFMLLIEYFFGCEIKGRGSHGNPYSISY